MITKLVNAAPFSSKKRQPASSARVTPTPADDPASITEESRNAIDNNTEKRSRGVELTTKQAQAEEPSVVVTMARLNLGPMDVGGGGGDDHPTSHPPDGDGGNGSSLGGTTSEGEGKRQQQRGGDDGEEGSDTARTRSTQSSVDKLGDNAAPFVAFAGPVVVGGGSRMMEGGYGGRGGTSSHEQSYSSPALASVDTAASTQPPPSPLQFGGVSPEGLLGGGGESGGGDVVQQFQFQYQQQPQQYQYQYQQQPQQYQQSQSQQQQQQRSGASAWSSPWGTLGPNGTANASTARPPLGASDEDFGGAAAQMAAPAPALVPGNGAMGGVWGAAAPAPAASIPSRTPSRAGGAVPPSAVHRRSQSWEDSDGPQVQQAGGQLGLMRYSPGRSGRAFARQLRQDRQLNQQGQQQGQGQGQGQWVPSMQQQQQPSSPSVRSRAGQQQQPQSQPQQQQQQYEYRPREFMPQSAQTAAAVGGWQAQAQDADGDDNPSPLSSPSLSPRLVPVLHGQQQQQIQPSPLLGPQALALAQAAPRVGKGGSGGRQQPQQQHYQQQQQQQQQQHSSPGLYQMQQQHPHQQQQHAMQYQLQPRPSPQHGGRHDHGGNPAAVPPLSPGLPPRGGGGGHPWGAQQQQQQQQQQPSSSAPTSPSSGVYHPQQQQQQQHAHHNPHHSHPQQHPMHQHHGGGPRDRDRGQHQHQQHAAAGGGGPSSSSASAGVGGHPSNRSAPEILKTLLRKKACLYEPSTSHAVALVTWLVGRKLTLSRGYFSRQHLQSGVHDVVSSKIEAGIVTRTKVNRCMQIILNSCFHYIIPRPDGTEEDGGTFRRQFARGVTVEDAYLLESLPVPWNNLRVDEMSSDDSQVAPTPSADGGGGGGAEGESGGGLLHRHHRRGSSSGGGGAAATATAAAAVQEEAGGQKGGGGGSKRSVLLCFNENVRSARDVFTCHNEFIRDAAHGANLLLTGDEWRSFYSGAPASDCCATSDPSSTYQYHGGGGGTSFVGGTHIGGGRGGGGGSDGGGGGGGDSTPSTSSTGMSVSPASLSPALRPSDGGGGGGGGGAMIQPPVLLFESSPSQSPPGAAAEGGPGKASVPYLSLLPRVREETTKAATTTVLSHVPSSPERREVAETATMTTGRDVLGEMDGPDLAGFRTKWCAKRYDHDEKVCGFAHVDVNRGWLRRDPTLHPYGTEMCPDVRVANKFVAQEKEGGAANAQPINLDGCYFNSCGRGVDCPHAHSREEVDYHPDRYKAHPCPTRPCRLRDVCPNLHSAGGAGGAKAHRQHHNHHQHPSQFGGGGHQYAPPRSAWHRREHGGGGGGGGGRGGGGLPHGPFSSSGGGRGHHSAGGAPPASSSSSSTLPYPGGAPTMYVGAAPESDFDRFLLLPGLRDLFRRRSATLYAYHHNHTFSRSSRQQPGATAGDEGPGSKSHYNNFGDDWGLAGSSPS